MGATTIQPNSQAHSTSTVTNIKNRINYVDMHAHALSTYTEQNFQYP